MPSHGEERYILEGHEGELQRLADQHDVLTYASDNKLVFAPVDFSQPGLRILDSGCADGLWLRRLQASLGAQHEYIGTDINPKFFPKQAQPGITLQVQSITQDWPEDWTSTFDYVHQRSTLIGAGKVSTVEECIERLVKLVKPGGWIEFFESDLNQVRPNGPVMDQLMDVTKTLFDMLGVGYGYTARIRPALEKAGLIDIQEVTIDAVYGAGCDDPEIVGKGMTSMTSAGNAIYKAAKGESDSLKEFTEELHEELAARGGRLPCKVVWARKP
ncbi:S-adenosyl-L-methionine-dependent methyltransferase [Hypoxylon trugodes]|uniref:S-adenosyl-L-methionine-dependent methyltransferase n=1 Tax=Hypoxylon trugodes TaxID=326681 RepID=UPI002196776F|nr:S-adenosyl-L-methionine-dependent methyltransferase [Hypoxylon trugodes]KAI1384529.1 S-adenosyl-L-methionine-dependent methyltransferase [Hypoxylon trugodes]